MRVSRRPGGVVVPGTVRGTDAGHGTQTSRRLGRLPASRARWLSRDGLVVLTAQRGSSSLVAWDHPWRTAHERGRGGAASVSAARLWARASARSGGSSGEEPSVRPAARLRVEGRRLVAVVVSRVFRSGPAQPRGCLGWPGYARRVGRVAGPASRRDRRRVDLWGGRRGPTRRDVGSETPRVG